VDEKHVLLPIALAVLLLGGGTSSLSAGTPRLRAVALKPLRVAAVHVNPRLTRRLRHTTWYWQSVIGLRRSHLRAPLASSRALRFWRRHAHRVLRLASRPPHLRDWMCIHRYEGSWRDSGDPYWGGLQMDRGFMLRYAAPVLLRRGWANHWSPLAQMWVAERAFRSGRGFYPWPNTARICGLI
jgi:hypothetical protein